jgi:hypothetical protein
MRLKYASDRGGDDALLQRQRGEFPRQHAQRHAGAFVDLHARAVSSKVDEIRICPADPLREQRLAEKGTSYMMNDFLVAPALDQEGNIIGSFASRQRLEYQARTLATFIASDRATGLSADHAHCMNWRKGWKAVLADIAPDRHRSGAPSADR